MTMPADKKRSIPARNIAWSTKLPPAAGDSSTKLPTDADAAEERAATQQRLSEPAREARTAAELWLLFITEEMLDLVVKYTNEKIQEGLEKACYSQQRIRKSPYLRATDKVSYDFFKVHELDSFSSVSGPGRIRFFIADPHPDFENLDPDPSVLFDLIYSKSMVPTKN